MLPIEVRIDRAQRLLRMLEEDVPLLSMRIAELTPESQHSAKTFASQVMEQTRAEMQKLLQEKTASDPGVNAEAAD